MQRRSEGLQHYVRLGHITYSVDLNGSTHSLSMSQRPVFYLICASLLARGSRTPPLLASDHHLQGTPHAPPILQVQVAAFAWFVLVTADCAPAWSAELAEFYPYECPL